MVARQARIWWHSTWQALAPIGGSLFAASVVLCNDIVLGGGVAISYFACPVWLFLSVIVAVVQRPRLRFGIPRVLAPVLTLLTVLANNSVQERVTMANAHQIIRACENYREANGRYPDRLDQLTPNYLKAIPRAKYCVLLSDFLYSGSCDPVLFWYPSIGRRSYRFETHTWRKALD
jgi:hypothetical protein